jgi:hypothetical protein
MFAAWITWVGSWIWPTTTHKHVIRDRYASVEALQEALRRAGLESCNLVVAMDYTKSNEKSGMRTFGGQSLHTLSPHCLNPYQTALRVLGQTLEPFDDDRLIPVMGFGDERTKGKKVFWFKGKRGEPCRGFQEALECYAQITPEIQLSGPTSFAPAIHEAMTIVRQTGQFHLLVIIADGQVTDLGETRAAIVAASALPMAILVVGVGDGHWDEMERFDDELPERKFDNLNFVNFHEMMTKYDADLVAFTTEALAELPAQFKEVRRLGLLQ